MELALSSFSTRRLLLLIGSFGLLLVLCLVLGIFAAPDVVVFETVEFARDDHWEQIVPLSAFNQGMLTMVAIQTNFMDVSASKTIDAQVVIRGRNNAQPSEWTVVQDRKLALALVCVESSTECNPVEVARIPYVMYDEYAVEVLLIGREKPSWILGATFWSEFVNAEFTVFEVASRAVFAVLAVGFGAVFVWKLRSTPFREWADEQKWTLLLLGSLLGLDDPLFALSLKWAFFDAIDQLMAASFLSVLLLFWLVMLDSMMRSQENSVRSFRVFYLRKDNPLLFRL